MMPNEQTSVGEPILQKKGKPRTPTKYRPKMCEAVRELGKKGLLVTAAARAMGISPQSFALYEKRHPEFREAAKRVRENSAEYQKGKLVVLYAQSEAKLLKALAHIRGKQAAYGERLDEWRKQGILKRF